MFVELPIDTLYPVSEVRANMGLSKRQRREQVNPEDAETVGKVILPEEAVAANMSKKAWVLSRKPDQPVFLKEKTKMPWFVEMYLQFCLRRMFGGAFNKQPDVSPLPVRIPMPSGSQVRRAAKMVAQAKHPVFIIASQATLVVDKVRVCSVELPAYLAWDPSHLGLFLYFYLAAG